MKLKYSHIEMRKNNSKEEGAIWTLNPSENNELRTCKNFPRLVYIYGLTIIQPAGVF